MDESLRKQMESLRAIFVAELTGKMQAMEEAWADLAEGEDRQDALRRIHSLAHSLAGSGSTFGFDSMSARADELEAFLKPLLEAPAPLDVPQRDFIRERLDDIKKAAEAPDGAWLD